MAIAPTGAIYKSLIFDGEDSRDYGVYITGQAVFNAPEREVEMITIPARNGLFALDQGRFENIEVTYPAGIFADSDADFAQAISDFRNFLCSRKGYCRLTDDYNPDEYRMAIYKSGLEVTPTQLKAGTFDITFDCMPQRFLTSGETAVTIASGDTITNPTLFESSPLLETLGAGDITINGETISLVSSGMTVGEVVASNVVQSYGSSVSVEFDTAFANNGDSFSFKYEKPVFRYTARTYNADRVTNATITPTTQDDIFTEVSRTQNSATYYVNFNYNSQILFEYGTAKSESISCTLGITATINNASATGTATLNVTLAYDGGHTITISYTASAFSGVPSSALSTSNRVTIPEVVIFSSTPAVYGNHPVYVDLELGDAYIFLSGARASVNNALIAPAKLPTLKAGTNEITFTVTTLKITPRWWKI